MSAHPIRLAAPLAALLLASGMAAAQTGVIDPDRAHPGLAHSAQPTKDFPADATHPALSQFSMQDRAEIYRALAGGQNQNGASAGAQIELGARLPDSIQVQPFPDTLTGKLPALKSYNYALSNGQVLLVEPNNKKVADIIRQ